MRFSHKAMVTDFVLEEDIFVLTDFYFAKPYSWPVTAIGPNPHNRSEMLVFDLSQDPHDLAMLADNELVKRLSARPKPIRGMRTNAGPIVLPYDEAPAPLLQGVPDFDELSRRASRILADSAFTERLIKAFMRTRGEKELSPYVEEQIYDRFTTNADQALLDRFHGLEWRLRVPLIEQLADERLRALGRRLFFVEAPDVMEEAARREYEVAVAGRLMADDNSVPWLTLPKAIDEADDLLLETSGQQAKLLTDLRHYLSDQARHANSLLSRNS